MDFELSWKINTMIKITISVYRFSDLLDNMAGLEVHQKKMGMFIRKNKYIQQYYLRLEKTKKRWLVVISLHETKR